MMSLDEGFNGTIHKECLDFLKASVMKPTSCRKSLSKEKNQV